MSLPKWMRIALLATAPMNLLGSLAFLPPGRSLRLSMGWPPDGHPIYAATVGLFIFLFGVAYLWTGLTGRADRLFITLAASGKLAFFLLTVWFWLTGTLSGQVPASAGGDLVFALLFFVWLFQVRSTPPKSGRA
jgi:hypothetical protein